MRHMSIAKWLRQAMKAACRQKPLESVGKKLEAIRIAAQYEYPTGDIDHMLAEIEAGYRSDAR